MARGGCRVENAGGCVWTDLPWLVRALDLARRVYAERDSSRYEAESGRQLRELLVKDGHVLACACRERLRRRPAAPRVEAGRKVCADPGVGDSLLRSPLLQVLLSVRPTPSSR
jgi:hypothetical protein